jgi:hypothetical protein
MWNLHKASNHPIPIQRRANNWQRHQPPDSCKQLANQAPQSYPNITRTSKCKSHTPSFSPLQQTSQHSQAPQSITNNSVLSQTAGCVALAANEFFAPISDTRLLMFAKREGSSSVNLLSPISTTTLSEASDINPSGRAPLNEFDRIISIVKFFIDSKTSTVPLNLFDSSTRYSDETKRNIVRCFCVACWQEVSSVLLT